MSSKQRLITATIGWVIAFGIIMLASPWLFNAVICLMAVFSFNELLRMFKINEEPIFYRPAMIIFVGICLAFLSLQQRDLIEATLILALLGLFTVALRIPEDKTSVLEHAAKIVFSGAYVLFLLYFIKLRLMPNGRELVFVLCAGTWGRDLAAYLFGRLIKSGHVILPAISPRKTYEGAAFATLFTIFAVMLSAQWLLPEWMSIDKFVVGTGIGVLGQIGDLAESWLKRKTQVSDSSQILPGQGGVLDSFDSFIFTAPAIYLYATLIMAG